MFTENISPRKIFFCERFSFEKGVVFHYLDVLRKIFSLKINYFLKKYFDCDESSMVVVLLMINVINYIICASYCSVMIMVVVLMINYLSKKIYLICALYRVIIFLYKNKTQVYRLLRYVFFT